MLRAYVCEALCGEIEWSNFQAIQKSIFHVIENT